MAQGESERVTDGESRVGEDVEHRKPLACDKLSLICSYALMSGYYL